MSVGSHTKLSQDNLEHQKAALKAENKKVMDTISDYFTANADSKKLVVRVPISANSKAISEAIKTISSKNKDKTIYLFAADETEGKVVHGCHVAEVCVFPFIILLQLENNVTVCMHRASNCINQGP